MGPNWKPHTDPVRSVADQFRERMATMREALAARFDF
jgi:hypothetical protein